MFSVELKTWTSKSDFSLATSVFILLPPSRGLELLSSGLCLPGSKSFLPAILKQVVLFVCPTLMMFKSVCWSVFYTVCRLIACISGCCKLQVSLSPSSLKWLLIVAIVFAFLKLVIVICDSALALYLLSLISLTVN